MKPSIYDGYILLYLGRGLFRDEFVTCGGVSLKEVGGYISVSF